MDISNNTNTSTSSSSWDFDMGIGNQLNPFEMVQPVDPFEGHIPSPSFPGPQMGGQREMEGENEEEDYEEGLGAMKEMMYKIAAMQPVDIDPLTIKKPKRRNVRISDDPQSIAARHRRERISERIRILQRLVPGGTKMDTASMLDEAIRYVKFLKRQVQELQSNPPTLGVVGGHPEWVSRPDMHGSSSASTTMGGPSGLGINFTGEDSCDRMDRTYRQWVVLLRSTELPNEEEKPN